MIGDSIFEVFLTRVSIFALRAVTPICFLILPYPLFVWRWKSPDIAWGSIVIPCYALSECLFFLGVYLPHKCRLKKLVSVPPSLQKTEREILVSRCLGAVDDPDDFIRGWFCGATLDVIRRENLREWITCVLLPSESANEADSAEWELESEHYILEMERTFGWVVPPGKTEGLKFMRLNTDPINAVHRPLIWYIIVGVIDVITHICLARSGLEYYSASRWFRTFPPRPQTFFAHGRSSRNEIPYWYRPHLSSTKKPIVLIHGIGIGLFAYVLFIRDILLSDRDVGVVIVEVLPISMRIIPLTGPSWMPRDFCDSLHEILRAHSIEQFVLIGHSYGTFLSAYILRDSNLEPRVHSVVLIDPIPFLLFQPFLVHNFVYRVPGAWRANECMIWYFSSRDISVAALLQRHFFWSGGVLWRDDAVLKNRNTLVVLAGQDQIIPSSQVWKYLTGSPVPELGADHGGASREVIEWTDGNVKAILNTKLDHAQILTRPSKYSPIINHLDHLSSS